MPTCLKCDGVGTYWTPGGVFDCDCQDLSRRNYGLIAKFAAMNSTNWETDGEAAKQAAIDRCREYVNDFERIWGVQPVFPNSLLMLGTKGTGRTMLANLIGWALFRRTYAVQFWNEKELFDSIQDGMKADNGRDQEILKHAMQCDLLILDDIGVTKMTDYRADNFYRIINKRYEEAIPVIITSNLTRKEIADIYGARIESRLAEMCGEPLVCKWADYRKCFT